MKEIEEPKSSNSLFEKLEILQKTDPKFYEAFSNFVAKAIDMRLLETKNDIPQQ